MLGLKLPTDPRWVNIAEKDLQEILTDHAWCEQKAATSGITFIVRYPDKQDVVTEMNALVAEEWGHFRKVLRELEKRNLKLGRQRKDLYVVQLLQLIEKGGSREKQLVEHLLVNALIEARSCERFRLLSLHMNDEYFRAFYHEFMVSEAGHYRMFLDLAKNHMPAEHVQNRWQFFLNEEAKIMERMDLRGDRIH
ncbi:MAG: tRNA-(ms[2]io[6]A)-hydroxylase [Bacteroidia bacterium]|nr:tRNA-(ms[2]io[6]A)-hydroxylase [Bacteroidia bacterium]